MKSWKDINFRIPAGVRFCCFALAVMLFVLYYPAVISAEEIPRAWIEYRKGDVTVDGKTVEAGDAVYPGAVVKTGSDSFVDILIDEQSIVRVNENSKTRIEFSEKDIWFDLKAGAISGVINKALEFLKKAGKPFRFTTVTATAGIRGTLFYMKLENVKSTYICCCNGVLHVEDANGKQRGILKAKHHESVQFIKWDDGHIERIASRMKHHTDTEMEELAKKIGIRIDWSEVGSR